MATVTGDGMKAMERAVPEKKPRRGLAARWRLSPSGLIASFVLVAIVIVAIVVPFLPTYPYDQMSPRERLQAPSASHIMGTDQFGRDVAVRVAMGARVSLLVAAGSLLVALAAGVVLGVISGYYQARIDEIIMRILDGLSAFPAMLLALILVAILGPRLTNLMIAIGVVYTPSFARVARANTLSIREQEYIESARSLGATNYHILTRHVLPNIMPSLIVQLSMTMGYAVLLEAALSFLGLGAQPPLPSWGNMLQDARSFMMQNPWMAIFPGLALVSTVYSLNVLGDALRDRMDPHHLEGA